MDKNLLITNIQNACKSAGVKPTTACMFAGVGKSFISHIRDGQMPSVAKVADLAAYLGVSVSDLVGDATVPAELAPLADAWAVLNEEGRQRLVEYADDLVQSGKYIKSDLARMDQREA